MDIQNEIQEKEVSNNKMFRNISNLLNSIPYFKDSSLRYSIHGLYHNWIGYQKEKAGNLIGAKNERERANFQFNRASLIEKKNKQI